ncbi:hypothetical protein SAMN04489733_1725 [Amycolatopsis keratiniphila]|nr:hypothetical protein SAMN04489733_1725 [Amycolatopsis keratiniphila]
MLVVVLGERGRFRPSNVRNLPRSVVSPEA